MPIFPENLHFQKEKCKKKIKNSKKFISNMAGSKLCRWDCRKLVQLPNVKVALQGVRIEAWTELLRIMEFIAFTSNVVWCCWVWVCSELFMCACYVTCHVLVVAVKTVSQSSTPRQSCATLLSSGETTEQMNIHRCINVLINRHQEELIDQKFNRRLIDNQFILDIPGSHLSMPRWCSCTGSKPSGCLWSGLGPPRRR